MNGDGAGGKRRGRENDKHQPDSSATGSVAATASGAYSTVAGSTGGGGGGMEGMT